MNQIVILLECSQEWQVLQLIFRKRVRDGICEADSEDQNALGAHVNRLRLVVSSSLDYKLRATSTSHHELGTAEGRCNYCCWPQYLRLAPAPDWYYTQLVKGLSLALTSYRVYLPCIVCGPQSDLSVLAESLLSPPMLWGYSSVRAFLSEFEERDSISISWIQERKRTNE